MGEYIEREALLDGLRESRKALQEICKGLKFPIEKQICDAQILTFQECILRVKEHPTADVVEVVRCKNCKHFRKYNGYERGECRLFTELISSMQLNDYCSYGERKCEDG